MAQKNPLQSHRTYQRGDNLSAEDLNMLISSVRAIWNMSVSAPLRLHKGRGMFALSMGSLPPALGAAKLAVAAEDVQPRSLGKFYEEDESHNEDKGSEPFTFNEVELWNPFGFTIPYGTRVAYMDVGTTGPEVLYADVIEEWTTRDIPVYPKEFFDEEEG